MTASLRASEQDANSGLIAPEYTSLLLPALLACRAACLVGSLASTAAPSGKAALADYPPDVAQRLAIVSALGAVCVLISA